MKSLATFQGSRAPNTGCQHGSQEGERWNKCRTTACASNLLGSRHRRQEKANETACPPSGEKGATKLQVMSDGKWPRTAGRELARKLTFCGDVVRPAPTSGAKAIIANQLAPFRCQNRK